MKITSLTLKDYIPLVHKNTHRIEYEMNSPYQIIIGSNGCGKSSLLRRMSPLPPSEKLFLSGGSQEIHINHNNSAYVLISDFSKGSKHTFIKDGVKLNDAGTKTAQLSLVYEWFGLTPEVFDVLVGDKLFTKMSVNERHYWMMKISGLSLELAMKIFNEFKTRARDSQGYVNQLNKRLSEEHGRRIDDIVVESFKAQRIELNEQYEWFDSFSEKLDSNSHLATIEQRVREHEELSSRALKFGEIIPAWIKEVGINNPTDLSGYQYKLEADLEHNQSKLDQIYEESRETKRLVETIRTLDGTGRNDIIEVIARLSRIITEKKNESNGYQYLNDDVRAAQSSMRAVYSDLIELFSSLPDNSEGHFSRSKAADTEASQMQMRLDLSREEKHLNDLEHDLKHLRSDDRVECPKCNYSFVAGVVITETELESKVKVSNTKIARLRSLLISADEYLQGYNKYLSVLGGISSIFRQHPIHQDFFSKIIAYNYTAKPPAFVLEMLTDWNKDIEESVYIVDLMREVRVKQAAYDSLALLNDANIASINERAAKQEEDISNCLNLKDSINTKLGDVRIAIKKLSAINDIKLRLDSLVDEIRVLGNEELRNYKARFVSDLKRQILSESVELDKKIKEAETHNSLLDDILASVEGGKSDMSDFKLLTDNMSPKTGLIADVMLGFIQNFVDMMNDIINSVWTYPMMLHPCQNVNDDLDYKFKVSIKASPHQIADIAELSTAQTDIVNFAFKLIVAESLGLDDYPMYLDELAAQMDDQHRINMMRAINDLVESKRCSQMFFISHYAAQHGVFVNSEVCMLDQANIVNIPREYNKHVKMS